ncbi:MAG: hypothetical protein ACREU7_01480 [Burkholderiales bacterium]
MTVESNAATPVPTRSAPATLRLECLPAGACYVCAEQMVRSSGGKWLCKACGFLLTCCDP